MKRAWARDIRNEDYARDIAAQAVPATPLQLDPEVAAMFNGEPKSEQATAWDEEATELYIARKEIEAKVHRRILKAVELDCAPHDTLEDVYHVEGGTDPDGHTVDLRAEWGLQCTCGSHMMSFALCKHMIRVFLERRGWLADTWENEAYRPGIFSRAVQVDIENAAYKAARDAAAENGTRG